MITLPIATIQARRDQLAAQREQAIQQLAELGWQIAELEQQRGWLQRNVDGMVGGLQELDALLESPEAGLQLLLAVPPAP